MDQFALKINVSMAHKIHIFLGVFKLSQKPTSLQEKDLMALYVLNC